MRRIGGDMTEELRQAGLYWRQMQQLKASCACIRLHRNRLHGRLKVVEVVKAVGSSGGIAAWAVFHRYPFLWTGIIAGSQLLDALKNVFPFARTHKAAGDLTVALETIYIDAEDDWEAIRADEYSAVEVRRRRKKLKKMQLDAERKLFPDGFEPDRRLVALAEKDTETYFRITFGEEE